MLNVQIDTEPEKRVAVVSHRGPYDTVTEAFDRLNKLTEGSRLLDTPVAALVGIYYDDPKTTPPAELRSAAGIVVPPNVALPPGLTEVRLAAGKYARTTHIGPYQELPRVWARFKGAWLSESGQRPGKGPTYERYWNTPMNAKPHELKTELFIPLAG